MSALLPLLEGVSERSERGVWISVGQLRIFTDEKPSYVDGLICTFRRAVRFFS